MEKIFNQILILDDDYPTTYLVKMEIEEKQCCNSVISFFKAEEVLEYLEKTIEDGEKLPDVIFTDLNLPRIDGWEFIERLEGRFANTSIKKPLIYVLSTSFNPEDRKKAAEVDLVTDFIQKPLDSGKLDEVIKYASSTKVESV